VAMMVVLLEGSDGEFCVRSEHVSQLARLGVTNVALVRDRQTVGIVLEGWLFDPARSAAAALSGLADGGRALHPFLHMAVSATPVPAVAQTSGKE
jgi:hypothetical protein